MPRCCVLPTKEVQFNSRGAAQEFHSYVAGMAVTCSSSSADHLNHLIPSHSFSVIIIMLYLLPPASCLLRPPLQLLARIISLIFKSSTVVLKNHLHTKSLAWPTTPEISSCQFYLSGLDHNKNFESLYRTISLTLLGTFGMNYQVHEMRSIVIDMIDYCHYPYFLKSDPTRQVELPYRGQKHNSFPDLPP